MSSSAEPSDPPPSTFPMDLTIEEFLNEFRLPVSLISSDGTIQYFNRLVHQQINDLEHTSPERWRGQPYVDWIETITDRETDHLQQALKRIIEGESEYEQVSLPGGDTNGLIGTVCLSSLNGDEATWILAQHIPGDTVADESAVEKFDRAELLNELHETTRSLMEAHSPGEVVSTAISIAEDYFDFATVGIRLLEDGKLVMKTDSKQDDRLKGRGMPPAYEPGEGIVGRAFETGEPVVIDDLQEAASDLDFDYSPMKSAMLLPLEDHGIIGAASGEKEAFDDFDLELGRQFATDVKLALERARREETILERERELREASVDRDYLKTILDTIPGIFFTVNRKGKIVSSNQVLRDKLECSEAELQGTHLDEILVENSFNGDPLHKCLDKQGETIHGETLIELPNGTQVPVHLSCEVLKSDRRDQFEIICSGIDMTEQKRKNRQLRKQKRRLSLALNAANAGVWTWNLNTGEEFWDKNTEELFGLEPGGFQGTYQDFKKYVNPADRDQLDKVAKQAIEESGEFEQEFRIQTDHGDPRWLLSRGEVFSDEDGDPERMVGVTVDITQRKQAEEELERTAEEKEALLREVHHRVKNNMQIINSMLSMQSRQPAGRTLPEILSETRNRVRAMAMVHEHLYQSSALSSVDLKSYLETLCQSLVESSGMSERISLRLSIPQENLDFDIDQTIACGLIVNELVMNSLQHGYSDGNGGTINIQLSSSGGNNYRLVVHDDGKGFDSDFNPGDHSSMGLQILESIVKHELDGVASFSSEQGARVEVEF